ncbi:MAG TPA: hypothetical protein HPP77_07880 [Candidatus Hydrogenedentes bacterium]|nr:hypothetical protein [Candidatus Hydrogenedentota bacterium]HIJ72523.1 hypothetical protein [Candidatus Hydrogenedentota bacterium]
MAGTDQNGLDALIEASLAGEPLRPLPCGLRASIREGLDIVARLEDERSRFRRQIAAGAASFAAAILCGVLLTFIPGVIGWLPYRASGAFGHLDYLLVSVLPPLRCTDGLWFYWLSVPLVLSLCGVASGLWRRPFRRRRA